MSRPSDGMTLDELRDEFDWMFEFQSRMAERIRQDADLHNLVDYVTGLETGNAALREELAKWERLAAGIDLPEYPVTQFKSKDLERENSRLRELVRDLWPFVKAGWIPACPNRECCLFEECDADSEYECLIEEHMAGRMRELGVEVDG